MVFFHYKKSTFFLIGIFAIFLGSYNHAFLEHNITTDLINFQEREVYINLLLIKLYSLCSNLSNCSGFYAVFYKTDYDLLISSINTLINEINTYKNVLTPDQNTFFSHLVESVITSIERDISLNICFAAYVFGCFSLTLLLEIYATTMDISILTTVFEWVFPPILDQSTPILDDSTRLLNLWREIHRILHTQETWESLQYLKSVADATSAPELENISSQGLHNFLEDFDR